MKIHNHLLEGDTIVYKETPNKGGIIEPEYLILHFTAGKSRQSAVDWLCNPRAKASAHLVVGRNGNITQLAPLNVKTWHAGRSQWDGRTGMNRYSIGIEMDNAGKLVKTGGKYRAWFQQEYPEEEVLRARHKFDNEIGYWHTYTEIQIERVFDLACLIADAYGLTDILGHDDIAPDRKRDPGPAFPLESIRAKVLGRSEEDDEIFEVTAEQLNIRKGPGTVFETVSEPLAQGTRVIMIERRARWSKVDVEDRNDLEGWVYNRYIRKV